MFSFIKKLFGKNNTGYSSNLMDQAMNSAMENDAGRTSVYFTEESPDSIYTDEDYETLRYQQVLREKYPEAFAHEQYHGIEDDTLLQQMQHQQFQDNQDIQRQERDLQELQRLEMEREMNDMHDPYVNPGQDMMIDENHHGIDHGLGYVDQDIHHDHMDDFAHHDHFDDGGHHHDF